MPAISLGQYMKVLESVSINRKQPCIYCGNETLTITNPWFCSHCENLLLESTQSIGLKDPALMQGIEVTNGLIENDDYERALQAYGKLVANYNQPQFYYRYGLLHTEYSNSEITKIRYDREGFMEENARLREHASLLTSGAKKIFSHAIVMCNKEFAAGSYTPMSEYTSMMCNLKLGRLRAAKRMLEIIQKKESFYVTKYSEMVFYSTVNDQKNTLAAANALLKRESFSFNAFYYVALVALKSGQPNTAEKLLNALAGFIKSGSLNALLKESQMAQQII